MDTIEARNLKVTDLLLKREEERKLDIKKKKEHRQHSDAANEKIEFFEKTLSEKRMEIENALYKTKSLPTLDLPNHFNNISKSILLLQKYVAASNIFLRVYDMQKCHQILQDLTVQLKDTEEKFLPKKKFGFKCKNKNETTEIGNISTYDVVDLGKLICVHSDENFYGFKNKNNETLILHNIEILNKDVTFQNLDHCVVKLYGNSSTLHINNLNNCVVLCGPVSTSVTINNCRNCKFVLACQQLRLHCSVNIDIYLHVTSRAIMEDCTKISLAPYNLKYEELGNDFTSSGLNIGTNNWTSVDDFNWLNTEKHSPNWVILDSESRINDWETFYFK